MGSADAVANALVFVFFVLTCLAILIFLIVYHYRMKWEATSLGRHMVRSSAVLLAFLVIAILLPVLGVNYVAGPYVRLALALLFFGVWVERIYLIALADKRRAEDYQRTSARADDGRGGKEDHQ